MDFEKKAAAIAAAEEMAENAMNGKCEVTYRIYYLSRARPVYRLSSHEYRNLPLIAIIESDGRYVSKQILIPS